LAPGGLRASEKHQNNPCDAHAEVNCAGQGFD